MAFNLRSLLVAAIVLSNCISWTASRHHYTHNVSGHRSRHRRQGAAGLFLPATFVIPGGDGEGWGEWGPVSACSRTCGGGVASQKRMCLKISPDGHPQCSGGDTKYFSCQTQDCPEGSIDFRAHQCSLFNDKDYRGARYEWIPFTNVPNPCELNCMPRGGQFYYRYVDKVIDGTRCYDDSFDVCVDGQCQAVGCDMMLGSNAREDNCRVCRGNGTTCHTTIGVLDPQDYIRGYNDILLIPEGSTNIVIEEQEPSSNFLALRSEAKNDTYYLNGYYHIDLQKSVVIAGALWHYERDLNGVASPDKLSCLGPTKEPLYLSVYYQGKNVGIAYNYSVPNTTARPTDELYHWVYDAFAPCTLTCGGGSQVRNVTCRTRDELQLVKDDLCDEGLKPATSQSCNTQPCPARWQEGPWGNCSQPCGKGGHRSRNVTCERVIANGISSIVNERECFDVLGPKPELFQKCNEDTPCPTWFTGPWKRCDKLCGKGKETRHVICHVKVKGRVSILADKECAEEKPQEERECMLSACGGTDWMFTKWFDCDSCLLEHRSRHLVCATNDFLQQEVDDRFCAHHKKPAVQEPCPAPPTCNIMWYATQWSKCSVECGEGVMKRKVFCGEFRDDTVVKVEDSNCDAAVRYHDTKPCSVPKEKCPPLWYSGNWTKCSKPCGSGVQKRRAVCFNRSGNGYCDNSYIPDPTNICNDHPCPPETSVTSSVSPLDGLKYCDDATIYEEVGADEDLTYVSTTYDAGSGSSGPFAETESSIIDGETGSGLGHWTLGEDLSTPEGSGLEADNVFLSTADTTTDDVFGTNTDFISVASIGSGSTDTNKMDSNESSVTTATSTDDTSTEDYATTAGDGTVSSSSIATTPESSITLTTSADRVTTTEASAPTAAGSVSGSTEIYTGSTGTETTSESESNGLTTSSKSIDQNNELITSVSDSTPVTTASLESGSTGTETTIKLEEPSTSSETVPISESTQESSTTSESESTGLTISSKSIDQTTEISTSVSDSATVMTASPESGSTGTESTIELEEPSTSSETVPISESTRESSTTSESESTGLTISSKSIDQTTEISTSVSDSATVTTASSESGSTGTESTIKLEEPSTSSETVPISESTRESSTTSESESTGLTISSKSIDQTTEISTSVSDSATVTAASSESGSTGTETTIKLEEPSTSNETVPISESTRESSTTSKSESTGLTISSKSIDQTTEISTSVSDSATVTAASSESGSTGTETTIKLEEPSTSSETVPISESTRESSTTSESESTGLTISSKSIDQTTEISTSVSDSVSITTASSELGSTVTETTITVEEPSTSSETVIISESTSETTTTSESGSSLTTTSSDSIVLQTTVVSSASSTFTPETTTKESTGSEVPTSTTSIPELPTTTRVSIFKPQIRQQCIPRPRCDTTEFGCCPDNKTAAQGPFDLGCEIPETCHETEYGCCPDGVTPSKGDDWEGCQSTPCAETLYGCCVSDNKTAAEGNDQYGCPEAPPCISANYGCCADNVTAAIGPDLLGCPEKETTVGSTPTLTSESTSDSESTSVSATETSSVSETGTSGVSETGTSTTSEPSSVSETGASGLTESGTSTIGETESVSETGTSGVTETGTSTTSEPSSVSETGTSGLTESGTSTISETSSVSETGPSSVTETGTSTISETGTSSVTETATGSISETSSVSGTGPSGVTETGTSSVSEFETTTENDATAVTTQLSTVLDDCLVSTFGCCYDNETEATGANGMGCPCNATEFGCCPDGESPAEGPNQQGCQGECKNTEYGCCGDGETPAHGPQLEGCCLLTAFGCCPDNHKPAEGPHLEGCGCHTSPYGCCPDHITAAAGPENKGCGCKYTRHGCCPDRHTEATGPNNEGCPCSTFQYGCCYDGVTVATGPQQEGCHCNKSIYGCCGDGETPANSPNASDCSCAASRFGCCPDGTTQATGPKFHGCTNVPENKQAVCSLPSDIGDSSVCHDYKILWFYDNTYGGCTQFWYSGCEGNGNRFATKEDCEDVCVHPAPKDACKLPAVRGQCEGDNLRWHYDSERGQCTPFSYGGCLGNDNNFQSSDLCRAQCEPDTTTEQCLLPIEEGSCAGTYSRWGYSEERGQCVQFVWGGCEGNDNRFRSEAACRQRCSPPGTPAPRCTEAQDHGNCTEKMALWSFNQPENRCVPFYYSGCGGNDNRFDSRTSCEQICPSAYVPDKCTLPYATGECSDYRERWFYDTGYQSCRSFHYGGCGGNGNNFRTKAECENTCSEANFLPTTTTIAPITRPTPTTTTTISPIVRPTPTTTTTSAPREDFCLLEIDAGDQRCYNDEERWAYDSATGKCTTFTYSGCGGNQNNYPDEEFCTYYCHPVEDRCSAPKDPGLCASEMKNEMKYEMKVYYDQEAGYCKYFEYGGCSGNGNRFDTLEECSRACTTTATTTTTKITTTTTVTTAAPPVQLPGKCVTPSSLERCGESETVFYYDSERRACVESNFGGCRHANSYHTEEECQRSCVYPGLNVCEARLDPGPCQDSIVKFHWDAPSAKCVPFAYGGCGGGPNRFSSVDECEKVCRSTSLAPVCLEQVDSGRVCDQPSSARWYYNSLRVDCVLFTYQGCGGSGNNFRSYDECAVTCHVDLPPNCTLYEDECKQLRCEYSVDYSYSNDGCKICACAPQPPVDCEPARQYCERLSCTYGVKMETGRDGCESCECNDDPCRGAGCSSSERCVAQAYQDSDTQEPRYSARCVPLHEEDVPRPPEPVPDQQKNFTVSEGGSATLRCLFSSNPPPKITWQFGEITITGNKDRYRLLSDGALEIVALRRTDSGVYVCVADNGLGVSVQEIHLEVRGSIGCEVYTRECEQLRCEYNVKHTPLPGGCTRCSCVGPRVDCTPFRKECEELTCEYGLEKYYHNGCPSCRCVDPCANAVCEDDERCIAVPYRDAATGDDRYTVECRKVNKPGMCPVERADPNEVCRNTCDDDASCRGSGKCCRRGCSRVCLLPAAPTTPTTPFTTTHAPDVMRAPEVVQGQEPRVTVSEGGKATLRCLFHSNPPPRITWRRGALTIDGNVDRYRLLSDGALEIVSLYRDDSGVYICVADNGLGVATREVQLVVSVPVVAHIQAPSAPPAAGGELSLTCEVDGFPDPEVYWSKDNVRLNPDDRTSISGDSGESRLTVGRLAASDSGLYACHARNEYSLDTATTQITVKQEVLVPAKCTDNPYFANCALIVRSNYCRHNYYGKFCCKSCVEAGQLAPEDAMQADQSYRRK